MALWPAQACAHPLLCCVALCFTVLAKRLQLLNKPSKLWPGWHFGTVLACSTVVMAIHADAGGYRGHELRNSSQTSGSPIKHAVGIQLAQSG